MNSLLKRAQQMPAEWLLRRLWDLASNISIKPRFQSCHMANGLQPAGDMYRTPIAHTVAVCTSSIPKASRTYLYNAKDLIVC